MLAWPKKERVDAALRAWTLALAGKCGDLVAVGYFGSYARGDWGVGSDLDLVVILKQSDVPFGHRDLPVETASLPVAADVLIYTLREFEEVMRRNDRFARVLEGETVWVWRHQDYRASPP